MSIILLSGTELGNTYRKYSLKSRAREAETIQHEETGWIIVF